MSEAREDASFSDLSTAWSSQIWPWEAVNICVSSESSKSQSIFWTIALLQNVPYFHHPLENGQVEISKTHNIPTHFLINPRSHQSPLTKTSKCFRGYILYISVPWLNFNHLIHSDSPPTTFSWKSKPVRAPTIRSFKRQLFVTGTCSWSAASKAKSQVLMAPQISSAWLCGETQFKNQTWIIMVHWDTLSIFQVYNVNFCIFRFRYI